MADFPIGISLVTWEAVGPFTTPGVIAGGATVTCPLASDDPGPRVVARSTASFPMCPDGSPYSFAVRGNMAVGAGWSGFSLSITDTEEVGGGFFGSNLAVWPIGCYEEPLPLGGTPTCTGESFFIGTYDTAMPSWTWDNLDPSVEVSGTPPVPFVLAWDHATGIGSLDWGDLHFEESGAPWQLFEGGVCRLKLHDETSNNSFSSFDPPIGPWDVQLTEFEVEIFATGCDSAVPEQCGRVTDATWNPAGL